MNTIVPAEYIWHSLISVKNIGSTAIVIVSIGTSIDLIEVNVLTLRRRVETRYSIWKCPAEDKSWWIPYTRVGRSDSEFLDLGCLWKAWQTVHYANTLTRR